MAVTLPLHNLGVPVRITARTGGQSQSVEQNRFTGAGFAGQRAEIGLPLKLKAVNQNNVADGERYQHGRAL